MIIKIIVTFWAILSLLSHNSALWASGFSFGDDFRLWGDILVHGSFNDNSHGYLLAEARMVNDASFVGTRLMESKVYVDVRKHWETGVGYLYAQTRSDADRPWTDHHWLQLEANPHWKLGEDWQFKLRNRLEVRWREGIWEDPQYVSRHRLYVTYPAKFLPTMTSLTFSNEVFYSYTSGRLVENRFYPICANFRLSERLGQYTFAMVRSCEISGEWQSAWVLGAGLKIRIGK